MNLPPSFNLFIGRTRELVEIRDALHRFQLVTLTGPGGCGKTRLALECAHQLADAPADRLYADGLTWCDLAAVADPAYVPARLVTALGLVERANLSSTDLIAEALHSQTRLVILDNCEHLLAGCATLAETILAKCPRVTILATSTQPLSLTQEHLYAVPPLAVPELPAIWNAERLATLSESDAVRLFLHRAREVFSGWLIPKLIASWLTTRTECDTLQLWTFQFSTYAMTSWARSGCESIFIHMGCTVQSAKRV